MRPDYPVTMRRLRPIFVLAFLSLVVGVLGCGGGSDSTETIADSGPDPARPGEAPTVAPSPTEGTKERAPQPVVVVSGRTARGDAFEVVARGTGEGVCLTTMYPWRDGTEGGAVCGDRLFPRLSTPVSPSGTSRNGSEEAVYGYASPEVTSIEVEYEKDGQMGTFQAHTELLPAEVLRAGGATSPLGFFVAFLPDQASATAVVALDSEGNELDTVRSP